MFDINARAHNFIKRKLEAGANTTDQNRPIGSKAVLNNQDVYWSGENYGWQSKESHEQLKKGAEFRAGHIPLTRLGTDILQGGGHVVEHTPDSIKQPVLAAARAINQGWKSLPSEFRGAVNSTLDFAGDVNEAVSKATNVSPIITGEVLTAGAGKLVKPLAKAGLSQAAKQLDAPVAHALTITNPDFIARGVTQGVASGPDFGPAMRRWNARRNELIDQVRYPSGLTPNRRLKNQKKSKITAYNDVSTGPTTDPLDVEAYGKKEYKSKGMDQHHLFPKQESYVFVEQMKKIGDDDDVLNLFLYAEELDATMGGRLSNMLNMDKVPHSKLHSARKADGRQLHPLKMANKVKSTKSTDELMELFDQYIIDNIKPSKAEAKQLQAAFKQTKDNLNQFKSLSEDARRRL